MNIKVIIVTPSGRRQYMDVLSKYILHNRAIFEWHLWDNCRQENDRLYIRDLANSNSKVKLVTADAVDRANKSVNKFYKFCSDPDAFYIKIDDDIVYFSDNMAEQLVEIAINERDYFLWWSPIVVNNAVCSWLLQSYGVLESDVSLTAQAGSVDGWRSPVFAEKLHDAFLKFSIDGGKIAIPNQTVSLSRFSINCIGFFGSTVKELGEKFCPSEVDDEEWLSAILPMILGKPGRVVGNTVVSHYSFFTQERWLSKTTILNRYYQLAGLEQKYKEITKPLNLKRRVRLAIENRLGMNGRKHYRLKFT